LDLMHIQASKLVDIARESSLIGLNSCNCWSVLFPPFTWFTPTLDASKCCKKRYSTNTHVHFPNHLLISLAISHILIYSQWFIRLICHIWVCLKHGYPLPSGGHQCPIKHDIFLAVPVSVKPKYYIKLVGCICLYSHYYPLNPKYGWYL
jgi:hypothetical protein